LDVVDPQTSKSWPSLIGLQATATVLECWSWRIS